MKKRLQLILSLVLFLCIPPSLPQAAVHLKVLTKFSPAPKGSLPSSLVLGRDGNLYGTTWYGGDSDFGTFFKISPTGALTTLSSLSTTKAYIPNPESLVEGLDGNFYGFTNASDNSLFFGKIFKLTPAGEITILCTLDGTNGSLISGLICGNDGNFYGQTEREGPTHSGTVFKMTPTGQMSTLAPRLGSNLIQGRDGNFYATSSSEGDFNKGVIRKLTPSGTITTVATFNGTNGTAPIPSLVRDATGNIYGLTAQGGVNNRGTLFKLTPAGALIVQASFNTQNPVAETSSLLLGHDGNFYGRTRSAALPGPGVIFPGNDTVFKLTPAGLWTELTTYTTRINGVLPGNLVQTADGKLYGTISFNGTPENGTIFQLTPQAVFKTLYTFPAGKDGRDPVGLVQGRDGALYGTTRSGGPTNKGTFFKISPTTGLNTLSSFKGANGSSPAGGLLQGPDDQFYGATTTGGPGDKGTIFKASSSGVITRLVSGLAARGPLTLGTDGVIYGTDGPSIFKLTAAGLTTLYHFDTIHHPSTGARGPLITDSNGHLYGMVSTAGYNGALFDLNPTGILTTLHQFNFEDYLGVGSLVQGRDKTLYGFYQNISLSGTNLFKLSPSQVYGPATTSQETAISLIGGSDGYLYGTTETSVFRLSRTGVLTQLISLAGTGMAYPTIVTQGHDGNLYGLSSGGIAGGGAVFGLTLKTPAKQTISFPAVGTHTSGETVTLNATANSGLPVTFRVVSGPATVSGNKLTITGLGLIRIAATQAGNLSYAEKEVAQNIRIRE